MTDREDERDGGARLRAWLEEAGCGAAAPRLVTALRWPVECESAAWSARVLGAAASLMRERARAIWRRQVAMLLLAAGVALPIAATVGFFVLRAAYDVLADVLPAVLATYVVGGYAMVALGVIGLTYAMLPLAIGRSRDRLVFAQSWQLPSSLESMEGRS